MTGVRQRRQTARQAARMGVLLRTERALWATGITRVAGVDEVGVGPLAGPLVAAAVVVPPTMRLRGVDDSKRLRPALREELAGRIRAEALAVSLGVVDVEEIDRLNVYRATLEAMRRAVAGLAVVPEHVVVDARTIPGIDLPQTAIVRGDSRSFAVAAASIVAKVARDEMMRDLDRDYPDYGFADNAGYGTAAHLAALARQGPCPAHRRSFAPVRQMRLPGISDT